jgi:hypothetical protein
MPEMVMADNGTMQKQPVPTNYTLPNGQNQTFIHVAFDNPQLQGLEILNFNNVTATMTENMTDNVTEDMNGDETDNNADDTTGR